MNQDKLSDIAYKFFELNYNDLKIYYFKKCDLLIIIELLVNELDIDGEPYKKIVQTIYKRISEIEKEIVKFNDHLVSICHDVTDWNKFLKKINKFIKTLKESTDIFNHSIII